MKYLIDTHIFLWSLFSPQKIPKPAVQLMILLSKDSKIPAYQKFGLNLLDHTNP